MTYYRDNPYAPKAHTPLIDLIPDHRHDLDVSDEEDSFYGKDDDFLIPVKWQNRIDNVPRRIKRNLLAAFGVAILILLSWCTYFGPRRAAIRYEIKLMDEAPAMGYGNNLRPDFKDMIQVKDMDEEHLPKKGKRLVFVGDVHGCKDELQHLLNKVDFRHKHDHLVLAGDMITKGRRTSLILSSSKANNMQAQTLLALSNWSANSGPPASAATGKTSFSSPSPAPNKSIPRLRMTSILLTSSTLHRTPTPTRNCSSSPRSSLVKTSSSSNNAPSFYASATSRISATSSPSTPASSLIHRLKSRILCTL